MESKMQQIMEMKKELDFLKGVIEVMKEQEAVEVFIMKCFRAGNFGDALHAHYREGKVINGKWVNIDEEDEEEEEEED